MFVKCMYISPKCVPDGRGRPNKERGKREKGEGEENEKKKKERAETAFSVRLRGVRRGA